MYVVVNNGVSCGVCGGVLGGTCGDEYACLCGAK